MLTLLITFEQRVLELWYFTWVILVTRPFRGYHDFWPCDLDVNLFFENYNLANNFWTVSASALIFHMTIPCDKPFPWVALFLTLWPWPWSLMYFLKILTLIIAFEQWLLELWYFTWLFLVIRPFCGCHYFLPCDLVTLTLDFDPFFENFNLANNFWAVNARALIFQMSNPYYEIFCWYWTFWPWHQ